jgi:hypothetical protein
LGCVLIGSAGALGNIVSDKLLLLRALRPQFPGALFFTANFDQAFTRESELPFSQNLFISSSYGPALPARLHRLQPGILFPCVTADDR